MLDYIASNPCHVALIAVDVDLGMVMTQERYLTVEQIAELLHVPETAVRGWLREGRLAGFMVSRKTGYRVAESEVDRFIREYTKGGTT